MFKYFEFELINKLYLGHEEPQLINPNPVLSFEKWISSVTERINQEMHYQFDGNPPTMVFHIHKVSNTFVDVF